jgi:hypothetical protein
MRKTPADLAGRASEESARGGDGSAGGIGHVSLDVSRRPGKLRPTSAMLKVVVKTIALLAILFVMLYVGMNNTHPIDFLFPVAGTTAKSPIHASAALIYFGVFAVGVLAGTILTFGAGSGGGGGRKGGAKDK